jgi:SWI/SNF-related matrix-associated actin-dependent regulator 1 of chromatin subfamily A
MIRSVRVDCWLPESVLSMVKGGDGCTVEVPDDHPMLAEPRKPDAPAAPPTGTARATSGGFAELRFAYDPKLIDSVKMLSGRRWDAAEKCWRVPATHAARLAELGFELDETLDRIANPPEVRRVTSEDIGIPGLYPFQVEGVRFLEARGGCGLLGDEMGLGKTIQAVAWLKLHPEARLAVIVVPASLKINWVREIAKWIPGDNKVVTLSGKKPSKKALAGAQIVIINYDILGAWLSTLLARSPVAVIADESHYIKSAKAARTKAVLTLARACLHQIYLSGTPITNRPAEFYTVLNALAPAEFANWYRYTERYCGAYRDRWGWQVRGATNTRELFEKVNGRLMLRRKKADVLKDLPEKRRLVIPMPLDNAAEYGRADEELLRWIRENFGVGRANAAANAEALVRFGVLKQLAAKGKLSSAVEWIENALETNGKLVVFAVHHATIDYLREALAAWNPAVVDGRVDTARRQEAVDRFQNDPECKVFLGNIKAAGVGLTLTAASTTVFVEMGWTPGEHDQAEDRVHRIGQEAASVEAYYLVAENTIEEEIAGILDEKREVLNMVLDGEETPESSMLTVLLEKRGLTRKEEE